MPLRVIKEAILDALGSAEAASRMDMVLATDLNPGLVGTVWDDSIYTFEETFGRSHKERVYQSLSRGGTACLRLWEEDEE